MAKFLTTTSLWVLLYALSSGALWAQQGPPPQSPPNGVTDGIEDLVTRYRIFIPMNDGTPLATDVYLPVLWDDLAFENINLELGFVTLSIPRLKLAERGHQLYYMPNQPDSLRLPMIFTRTPYNMQDPTQGQIEALLGYVGVLQDMRGRYASAGTYLPMYSDSWAKDPYFPPGFHHPLDTTHDHNANFHEDGHESVEFLKNDLRVDFNGDGVIDANDPIVSNGNIAMFGASALGNTQYQAAACAKIDPTQPGLKALFPIVASGEFYHSTGHHNGVFRERIIDGWLRGQVERYGWDLTNTTDNSVFNFEHTLRDYGPSITTPFDAADMAIAFWTEMGGAHYPNSRFRGIMDISHAPINQLGVSDTNGTVSRYENLQVPIYNLTGWWDIFIDGQIQTWQLLMRHLPQDFRKYQKLVIGPWAHQTIGSTKTGDMRYPNNVGEVLGASLDNIDISNLGDIAKSEIIDWFRQWLGVPRVRLVKLDEWQYVGNILGNDTYMMLPAEDYNLEFHEFFNFLTGAGPLPNFPIRVKGSIVDSNQIQYLTIPATGASLFGEVPRIQMPPPGSRNWDGFASDGIKNVRFYVAGPNNDGISGVNGNPVTGNYWFHSDTFPINNLVTRQKLYLRGDGSISLTPASSDEGLITYFHDPNDPVITHGGPNMIVRTPDGNRDSQGQMDFTDPLYRNRVLDRPEKFIGGTRLSDLVSFTSERVKDSLSIIGYSNIELYVKSTPLDNKFPELSNCDFIVRILDVYPDGREFYVFEGAVNARAHKYAESWTTGFEDVNIPWENIKSDSIYRMRFSALPIAYTFGAGHRIKVLVSSSSYPRYQSCPNVPLHDGEFYRRRPNETKTYTFNGVTMFPRTVVNSIAISDIYQTNIELPVYGKLAEWIPASVAEVTPATFNTTVYPNPASDVVTVTANKPGTYTGVLFSILGEQVMRTEFTNSTALNVQGLARGIYVLTITSPDGKFNNSQKLILK